MRNKIHEPSPQYRAMLELRRSNATVPVDPRPNKTKTRRDATRRALEDWRD